MQGLGEDYDLNKNDLHQYMPCDPNELEDKKWKFITQDIIQNGILNKLLLCC